MNIHEGNKGLKVDSSVNQQTTEPSQCYKEFRLRTIPGI